MTTRSRRFLRAGALAAALTLTAAACAGEPSAEAEHNDADTAFAQMMIVHHQGAIEMAELAVERASSPEVKELASGIAAAQQPEIDTMTGWLKEWGEPVEPDTGHGGMDHGGMEMDGMDQAEAMSELSALTGPDFDREFLRLMTAHHEGAVEMSRTEVSNGANAAAIDLANTIIDAQTKEIEEMSQLAAESD